MFKKNQSTTPDSTAKAFVKGARNCAVAYVVTYAAITLADRYHMSKNSLK